MGMKAREWVANSVTLASILAVFITVAVVIVYTNKTLHSIEKNLPNTLFSELNSLSLVLENIGLAVYSTHVAREATSPAHLAELQKNIDTTRQRIVELRETFVANNLVNASAFHAIVAPAVADAQIWLNEGVSGFPPAAEVTLQFVAARLAEAYEKAGAIKRQSQATAMAILDVQRQRLEGFQRSVNLLFICIVFLSCLLVFLHFRQVASKNRAVLAKLEIERQHDLLTNLLAHIPLGIAVLDEEERVSHLNPSFTVITGYNQKDFPTLEKWSAIAFPDPAYRQEAIKRWLVVLREGGSCELKIRCKDGTARDIDFRGSALADRRVVCTLTDVTERNRSERVLQESRQIEVRAKKMESLGLLAGGVAHDLNNILSGIVSYPELLLLELPADHRMRRPIEIMRESGLRASAIVQDLLTVARGVVIEKEALLINTIIEEYLQSQDYRTVLQFHPGVTVKTFLAGELTNILGSRIHIRKLLMNLFSNSCEAIGAAGSVIITTANVHLDQPLRGYNDIEEGEYVVLSVADDGKGISGEDLEKIFEPFYSKKVMGRSGTGLGLTVVWNVVRDHNGHIGVTSSPEGTVITIHLPVTSQVVQSPRPMVDLGHFKGHGERVLVVDDVTTQRFITTNIVEKLGYKVESVASGEAAVEFIRRQPVDLILLDMIMTPGISGRETYQRIVKICPGQKAIIVSGYAETDDVKETLLLGAGKFLRKPLLIEDLARAMRDELL